MKNVGSYLGLGTKGSLTYSFTNDTDTGWGQYAYGGGLNNISIVTGGIPAFAVLSNQQTQLPSYTAQSDGSGTTFSVDPNENYQPAQPIAAELCIDDSGNVVRGSQEATITLTRAQLNGTLSNTLIAAPGAGKFVVVEETTYLIRYSGTSSSTGPNLEIRQPFNNSANTTVSKLPGLVVAAIMNQPGGGAGTGISTRDVPTGGSDSRSYNPNIATTLHKTSNTQYVSNLISISFKLKYRLFDESTFE